MRILDYGHRNRRGLSRRQARWLVLITLLIVAIWQAMVWIPRLNQYLRQRRWQREELAALAAQQACMEFVLPADTLVYTDDPAEVAAMVGPGSAYKRVSMERRRLNGVLLFHAPPAIVRPSPQLLAFMHAAGMSWHHGEGWERAAVFMHERCSPSGNRRLVVIEVGPEGQLAFVVVLSPRSVFPFGNCLWAEFVRSHSSALRIYAGQPDPNDPSHFTIEFQYGEQRGMIHGRLNDNNTVSFDCTLGRITPGPNGRELHLDAPPATTAPPPAAGGVTTKTTVP